MMIKIIMITGKVGIESILMTFIFMIPG